jgi:DNA replication protein DnaC
LKEKLRPLLAKLKLRGIEQVLDAEIERAQREASPFPEVIYRLLVEEDRYREERSLDQRLKKAKIPWDWTLQTFPFESKPDLNRSQIQTLAGLSFVERAQNVVFIGDPGTGKTGLAIGLLRQAILSGYRCRFFNAQDLLDQLYASLADRSTQRLIKTLSRYAVLLIDEVGYLTLKPEQVNAFFRLMDERYGRTSTIITTNLVYADWYALFQRKTLVDALLNRLQHHCVTIHVGGPSLRVPEEQHQPTPPSS